MNKLIGSLLMVVSLALNAGTAHAQSREDARLITATQVLPELHASPDQNVPAWLMERAYGVAVIPDVIKAAMILGGMGPVDLPQTDGGKLFAGLYALYSGLAVLITAGIVFAPLLHRLMHRLHWDTDDS